jgi:hypothetical protein
MQKAVRCTGRTAIQEWILRQDSSQRMVTGSHRAPRCATVYQSLSQLIENQSASRNSPPDSQLRTSATSWLPVVPQPVPGTISAAECAWPKADAGSQRQATVPPSGLLRTFGRE